MFRSEPMQKTRLVCLGRDRRNVVSALHRIGMIDLRKSKLELSDDSPADHYVALSDAQIRLAGAIALLRKPKKGMRAEDAAPEKHISAEELISKVSNLAAVSKIYSLDEERKKIHNSIRKLEQSEEIAMQLSGIDFDAAQLKSNVLAFKAYAARSQKEMDSLNDEIGKRKLAMEVVPSKEKNRFGLLIAYQKGIDIESIARKHNLKELDISLGNITGTPKEALRNVASALAKERARIGAIEKELGEMSGTDYRKLSALMEMIKIEMTKAGASSIFKKTEKTVVIEGWVPQRNSGELEAAVAKASEKRYYMEKMATDELAPTLSNLPGFLKPFDYLIGFISVPRSD